MITFDMVKAGYEAGLIKLIDGSTVLGDGVVCSIGDNWFCFGGQIAEEYEDAQKYKEDIPENDIVRDIYNTLKEFRTEFEDEYLYYEYFLLEHGINSRDNNGGISLWGRLGVQIEGISPEEFEVLKKNDPAARELLISLIKSERCYLNGDSYFPPEPNEGYLSEELGFDIEYQPIHDSNNLNRALTDELERQKADVSKENAKASSLFVFDDELMVDDDNRTINGYLWAVDSLVDRLPTAETKDNINFYADYNVDTGSISVSSTYWTEDANGKEVQKVFPIDLTDDEKTELISALEGYCKSVHSVDCLEFVNQIRREEGLEIISKDDSSALDDRISSAVQKMLNQAQTAPEKQQESVTRSH